MGRDEREQQEGREIAAIRAAAEEEEGGGENGAAAVANPNVIVDTSSVGSTRNTIDTPVISGDLGFRQHTGGHTPGPTWPTFITFAERYFQKPAATHLPH